MRASPVDRFRKKYQEDPVTGCWLWTAGSAGEGYGTFFTGEYLPSGNPRMQRAHIWSYEHFVGPIPEGLELDHVCHTEDPDCLGGPCAHRRCVNPDHLEPVTPLENRRRGKRGRRGIARGQQQSSKTHCPRGHPYTGSNLYTDPKGGRRCRECVSADNRERYLRAKSK